jgi:hypothetical protein
VKTRPTKTITKLTPQNISDLLKGFFPDLKEPKYSLGSNGSNLFHDLCQIGALLTDEAVCVAHLKVLDAELRRVLWDELKRRDSSLNVDYNHHPGSHAAVMQRKVQRTDFAVKASALKHGYNSNAGPEDLAAVKKFYREWNAGVGTSTGVLATPKFHGALQKTLLQAEIDNGFNDPDLDSDKLALAPWRDKVNRHQTPTLTGFVAPAQFTDFLLKSSFQWKDPGAGFDHGEFTHRIQWWIIAREHTTGGPYKLRGTPPERFGQINKRKAPEHVGADLFMWDFLLDAAPAEPNVFDADNKHPFATDSFRSPNVLNRFLLEPERASESDAAFMPTLQHFLVARTNKRKFLDPLFPRDRYVAMQNGIDPADLSTHPADGKIVWKKS